MRKWKRELLRKKNINLKKLYSTMTNNTTNNIMSNIPHTNTNNVSTTILKKKQKLRNKPKLENRQKNNAATVKQQQQVKHPIINTLSKLYNKQISPVIPLNIFQYWHSDEMPSSVKQASVNIKQNNPEFNYYLYNDVRCKEFIQQYFSQEVFDTYNAIIPHAIKADLWRYCILYIFGGVYLDLKYMCINRFKFIYLTDSEYLCKDFPNCGNGIYNALMICKPNNHILLKAIYTVVKHVKQQYYGSFGTEATGPRMLKKLLPQNVIDRLYLSVLDKTTRVIILYQNAPILAIHPDYRKQQKRFQLHWSKLWEKRQFYKKMQPTINPNVIDIVIPNNIIQFHDIKAEPKYIDKILHHCPGWNYTRLDEQGVIQFFKDNYIEEFSDIINKFYQISSWPHRSDLFRYYYLYINGGVWIDTDAMIETNINNVIRGNDFFTVYGAFFSNAIFNGFIGCVPKHDLIYRALKNAYHIDVKKLQKDYQLLCKKLFNIVITDRLLNKNTHARIYNEVVNNNISCKVVNKNNDTLLIHYWKHKKIPL